MPNKFLLVLSTIIYGLRTIFFLIGFIREKKICRKQKSANYTPCVSIVIPAKDEEKNIEECILSITQNKYPQDKFEIIAVNDRSQDRTGEILNNLQKTIPNLHVINLENDEQKEGMIGKAGALQIGIENSKGEIILITDADCTVTSEWISTMVQCYKDSNVGFVSSFTNVTGRRLFDRIQSIEWIYMHTMAFGGIGNNQALGCYGNNISIRRDAFDYVGGYRKIPFSVTEDLALQQAIHKTKYKVHYLIHPDALVNTKPCDTLAEYMLQHHRWVRGGVKLGWRATIFVLSSLAIWAGLIYFLWNQNFLYVLTLLLIRIIGDSVITIPSLIILKKQKYFIYLIFVVFFLLMELIAPLLLLNKKVRWKGQVFRN